MVRDTSLRAWTDIQSKLGDRQQTILITIHAYPDQTAAEIAYQLGHLDPNFARPRIHELEEKGLITSSGKRIDKITGKQAHTWRIKSCVPHDIKA